MNGMFCKPHMDSDKAEWVCKDIVGQGLLSRSQAKSTILRSVGSLPYMRGKDI